MRGKQAKKREIEPDAVYSSKLVAKLINMIMKDGKKIKAEKIVYTCMNELQEELKSDPLEAIKIALENVKPKLELRPRRVGGVNYQVPTPVPDDRQLTLAIKWIIEGARARRVKQVFYKALKDEFIDAYKGAGYAFKKKEDTHKMAEANKAFAHFQW